MNNQNLNLHRQLDLLDPKKLNVPIHLIGCGGIGSTTALMLSKMGFTNITVYDDDTIEDHNIPNQMFPASQCGNSKVQAMREICGDYGNTIQTVEARFEFKNQSGIYISGVDSMDARQDIWGQIKRKPQVKLYIDARMGATDLAVYTINPNLSNDIEMYEKSLYSDSEASQLPCTARSIIYNTFMIASIIGSRLRSYLSGCPSLPREIIMSSDTLQLITTA